MNNLILKLHVISQTLWASEVGQDLPEYALAVAIIACGTVATISPLAGQIGSAFNSVSGTLSTALA